MQSFWNTMKVRFKFWIKQNAQLIITFVDMLMPLIAILTCDAIDGPQGPFISLSICLIVQLILCVLRHFYAWMRERTDMPKPERRFTKEEKDGEVTIEYSRLQELILFMDDYENWLEANALVEEDKNGR